MFEVGEDSLLWLLGGVEKPDSRGRCCGGAAGGVPAFEVAHRCQPVDPDGGELGEAGGGELVEVRRVGREELVVGRYETSGDQRGVSFGEAGVEGRQVDA